MSYQILFGFFGGIVLLLCVTSLILLVVLVKKGKSLNAIDEEVQKIEAEIRKFNLDYDIVIGIIRASLPLIEQPDKVYVKIGIVGIDQVTSKDASGKVDTDQRLIKTFDTKLIEVDDAVSGEVVKYSASKKGVVSKTYRDGVLKFEIKHTKFGSPISGKIFDEGGSVIKSFAYDEFGQVIEESNDGMKDKQGKTGNEMNEDWESMSAEEDL